VSLKRTSITDYNGDDTDDLVVSFTDGGGKLVLLGVSEVSAVNFIG
jgi:hypothetical protein